MEGGQAAGWGEARLKDVAEGEGGSPAPSRPAGDRGPAGR